MQCADVNGDGKDELLVGSLSFNVYCLDGTGKVLWRHDLGTPVRALVVSRFGGGPLVTVGCEDGALRVFGAADGKPLYQYAAGSEALAVVAGNLGGAGQSLLLATSDGNLAALGAPTK